MADVRITEIREKFNTDSAQLPMNVVLIQEIPGGGADIARTRPVPITSMKDVATWAQPQFTVSLVDERQATVECSANLADEVKTKEDLLAHLSPEWVNTHLKTTADTRNPLNVQQRLLARGFALQGLVALLRRRPELLPHLAVVRAALQNDLERIHKELGE